MNLKVLKNLLEIPLGKPLVTSVDVLQHPLHPGGIPLPPGMTDCQPMIQGGGMKLPTMLPLDTRDGTGHPLTGMQGNIVMEWSPSSSAPQS